MFLKHGTKEDLVEILALNDLFDPFSKTVVGRFQHGEEVQDPEKFSKTDLVFPSGEPLPRCWLDAHYRDSAVTR